MYIKLSKKRLIAVYIFLYPICDIIFTLIANSKISMPISPNQIIRGFGLIIFFLFIKNRKSYVKIILISMWVICSFFMQSQMLYSTSFVTDLSFCLKFIQNFVLFYAFSQIFKEQVIEINDAIKYLIWSSYIVIISILLSYVGFGASSYINSSRFGVKGFFSIQSTITAYLLLILPLYYIRFSKNFSWQMLMCIFALFSIGSKTGVFGTIFEVVLISIFDIFREKNNNNKKIKYLTIFGLSVSIGSYIMTKYISYLFNMYYSNSYYYNLSAFLLSNRNDQLIAAKNGINLQCTIINKIIGKIFGYGYTSMSKIMSYDYNYESIERDFYGIYYYFGIICYVCFIILLFRVLKKTIIINFKYKFKNKIMYICIIIVYVGILYGWLGGHIFYEAMNQIPFWLICAYIYNCKNKQYIKPLL